MSWSTVLAVILLLGAVLLACVGVSEDNRAILDASGTLGLVGVGFSILSFRDQA